jgi:hypothetical protein
MIFLFRMAEDGSRLIVERSKLVTHHINAV